MRSGFAAAVLAVSACQLLLADDLDGSGRPNVTADAGSAEAGSADAVADGNGGGDAAPPLVAPEAIFVRRGTSAGDTVTTVPVSYGGPAGAALRIVTLPSPGVTLDPPAPGRELSELRVRATPAAALTPQAVPVTIEATLGGQVVATVASRLYVADYSGAVDTTFGTSGILHPCVPTADVDCAFYAMALDGDGRLVVAGSRTTPDNSGTMMPMMLVMRLDVSGSGAIDSTFASGGELFAHPQEPATSNSSTASGVAVDPSGRIVIAGLMRFTSSFVLRLLGAGVRDATHGQGGTALLPLSNVSDPVLALDTNGVFVGSEGKMLRLNDHGVADPSWNLGVPIDLPAGDVPRLDCILRSTEVIAQGRSGPVDGGAFGIFVRRFDATSGQARDGGAWQAADIPNAGRGCALAPDGRAYGATAARRAAGSGTDFGVARFLDTVAVDTTFGDGGAARFSVLGTVDEYVPASLALQRDGKLILLGDVATPGVGYPRAIVVARLEANGAPDRTFGSGGGLSEEVRPAGKTQAFAVALDRDGRILVLGNDTASSGAPTRPFVARFWP